MKPSENILIKIGEQIDSECVLFVQLVAICILNSFQSLVRGRVLQKDIPENISHLSLIHGLFKKSESFRS